MGLQTCSSCGKENTENIRFCGDCGQNLNQQPHVKYATWQRGKGDLAVKLGPENMEDAKNGVHIEAGTRALIFENGTLIEEIASGSVSMAKYASLFQRLLGRSQTIEVLLMDAGDFQLSFQIPNLKSQDEYAVHLFVGILFQVTELELFYGNVMKGRRLFNISDFRSFLFLTLRDALSEWALTQPSSSLIQPFSADLKMDLLLFLKQRLEVLLKRDGFHLILVVDGIGSNEELETLSKKYQALQLESLNHEFKNKQYLQNYEQTLLEQKLQHEMTGQEKDEALKYAKEDGELLDKKMKQQHAQKIQEIRRYNDFDLSEVDESLRYYETQGDQDLKKMRVEHDLKLKKAQDAIEQLQQNGKVDIEHQEAVFALKGKNLEIQQKRQSLDDETLVLQRARNIKTKVAQLEADREMRNLEQNDNLERLKQDTGFLSQKAVILEEMRRALRDDKKNEARSAQDLENDLREIDIEKLMSDEEYKELLRDYAEKNEDHEDARIHLLTKLEQERNFELRKASLGQSQFLDDEERTYAIKTEREQLEANEANKNLRLKEELERQRLINEGNGNEIIEEAKVGAVVQDITLVTKIKGDDAARTKWFEDEKAKIDIAIQQLEVDEKEGALKIEKMKQLMVLKAQKDELKMKRAEHEQKLKIEAIKLDQDHELKKMSIEQEAEIEKAKQGVGFTEEQLLARQAGDRAADVLISRSESQRPIEDISGKMDKDIVDTMMKQQESFRQEQANLLNKTLDTVAGVASNRPVSIQTTTEGTTSSASETSTLSSNTPSSSQDRLCTKCGLPNPLSSKFCENCGNKFI